jgi:hypothetical protein
MGVILSGAEGGSHEAVRPNESAALRLRSE